MKNSERPSMLCHRPRLAQHDRSYHEHDHHHRRANSRRQRRVHVADADLAQHRDERCEHRREQCVSDPSAHA